jgi:hypothetical protein
MARLLLCLSNEFVLQQGGEKYGEKNEIINESMGACKKGTVEGK